MQQRGLMPAFYRSVFEEKAAMLDMDACTGNYPVLLMI